MAVSKYIVKIINKVELIPNFWQIDFERPVGFEYFAGQYVSVKVGELGQRRSYSLASFPENSETIGLIVDVSPMGLGSQLFLNAKVGDEVEILGPMGLFSLENSNFGGEVQELVFVATGSGIVPIRSMIQHFFRTNKTQKVSLNWGMRFENVFWKEEFEALIANGRFSLDLVISKPTDNWKGCKGHVTDCLVSHGKTFENKAYYICGNQRMIGDVSGLLMDHGVPSDKIFFEKFY